MNNPNPSNHATCASRATNDGSTSRAFRPAPASARAPVFASTRVPARARALALAAALATTLLGTAACSSTKGVKYPAGVPVVQVNPDERGSVAGTGIESQDMVVVTDKMARSILGIPQIAGALTPPVVILDPVINDTRFAINKDIFLDKIRIALNQKAAGKVTFLARDRMAAIQREQQLKQTGQVTSSYDPNQVAFKGGDYILTGKLSGMSTRTSQGVSDYVLYSFQLIDMRTTAIVWEDAAEIKKQGLEDAAYR
jgi:PBP1b-binding outer membrane lipoprotein LpoB